MAEALGHWNYVSIILLIMIGLWAMIAKKNLFKKIIGMAIFQTGIIFFYIASSVKSGTTIPIIIHESRQGEAAADLSHGAEAVVDASHGAAEAAHQVVDAALYTNPLPHVLMLTAIVVGVATLGLALVMIQHLYNDYGSLEEDEILEKIS